VLNRNCSTANPARQVAASNGMVCNTIGADGRPPVENNKHPRTAGTASARSHQQPAPAKGGANEIDIIVMLDSLSVDIDVGPNALLLLGWLLKMDLGVADGPPMLRAGPWSAIGLAEQGFERCLGEVNGPGARRHRPGKRISRFPGCRG